MPRPRFRGRLTARRSRATLPNLSADLQRFKIDTLENFIRIGEQRAADRKTLHTDHMIARKVSILDQAGTLLALLAPTDDGGRLTVMDEAGTSTASIGFDNGKPYLDLHNPGGSSHRVGRA